VVSGRRDWSIAAMPNATGSTSHTEPRCSNQRASSRSPLQRSMLGAGLTVRLLVLQVMVHQNLREEKQT
jgi:hypothetical protein